MTTTTKQIKIAMGSTTRRWGTQCWTEHLHEVLMRKDWIDVHRHAGLISQESLVQKLQTSIIIHVVTKLGSLVGILFTSVVIELRDKQRP